MRRPYPTDLSDAEWTYIELHMPAPKQHGRPRIHSPREILDAIFYVLRSGCQWRLLPHDFPRWLEHLWVDAGYRGEDRGKDWVEKKLGWSVELVERPRKPAPEKALMAWAEQWMHEGVKVDWQKLLPPKGFVVLPRRWVVERSFAWISHNRRMSKDYERLCASGEAFVYAAMSRLMLRRLART
jgi:transposase